MSERIVWSGGSVTGEWNRPPGRPAAMLVLGHGAGGSYADAVCSAVAAGITDAGVATLRFNFPYREAGRRTPDKAERTAPFYAEIAETARIQGVPLIIGGKSYGGRVASLAAAEALSCDGIVFLGYPLHPPGKPDRVRDAHLTDIKAPMLFLQGTRDAFATPELIRGTVARLSHARLVQIEGGDHSFKTPGRPAAEVMDELARHVRAFIEALR